MNKKSIIQLLKKQGKIVGKLIFLLSVGFIVWAIAKLGFDFDSITNWPVFLIVSGISIIVKCITVYFTGFAWADWLQFFARGKIDRKEAVCIYAKANIGKYLPGNVMHYVERNMFASGMGISQKKIAVSSIIEIAGQVGVALLIAVCVAAGQLTTAIQNIFGSDYKKIILFVILIVIVLMFFLVFLFRKKIERIISDYRWQDFLVTVFKALLYYAGGLILLGLIMVVLYVYMGGNMDWHTGSLIVSGYIIAWVLGFIVPGASGGIGVREMVVTVLLGPVVGTELILTLSVIHRLITVIGDFLAYLVMLLIRRTVQGEK